MLMVSKLSLKKGSLPTIMTALSGYIPFLDEHVRAALHAIAQHQLNDLLMHPGQNADANWY